MILKNTAVTTKSWGGIDVPASGSYTVQEVDRQRLLGDSNFLTDLASGVAVINEDSTDLVPSVGKLCLKLSAAEARFNNLTNGFTSTNTQSAIEEAKNSSVGALYSLDFIRQGAAGNSWLYSGDSGSTTDTTPIIMPFNCKLVSASISNDTSARSFDIRVNVIKTGVTVDRSIVYQVRNARAYAKTDFQTSNTALNLSAGDRIAIYCQTQGAAPSDLVVTLGFKILSEANVITSDNTATTSTITVTLGGIVINLL